MAFLFIFVNKQRIEKRAQTASGQTAERLAFILIVFGIYISTKRQIIIPLTEILGILTDIERGKGDLTKRISIRYTNEFGELARLFNGFVDNIQNIIRSVIEKSNTLSNSAENLDMTAEQFSTSSLRMRQEAIRVADSTNSASEKVGTISDAASEMSNGMYIAASSIEQINVSVNQRYSHAED